MGRRNLGLDYTALHGRYEAGESSADIAAAVGIDPSTLRKAWQVRGLPTRNQSEAKRAMYARNPGMKEGVADAAHAARRGATDPVERRERRARTRERLGLGTSALEDRVAAWLDEAGVAYVRQKAVGPYNLDFAIGMLALEVSGGGYNPRIRANAPDRSRFLEARGWRIVTLDRRRLTREAVQEAVAG